MICIEYVGLIVPACALLGALRGLITGEVPCGECRGGELQGEQWGPCPTCDGQETVSTRGSSQPTNVSHGRQMTNENWQADELSNYGRKGK